MNFWDRKWTDHTYPFKTRKTNPLEPDRPITNPNPAAYHRHKKIEEHQESLQLRRELADVWE